MTKLRKPGVVLHAFFLAEHVRDQDSAAGRALSGLWQRVATDLGIREAFVDRDWPTELSPERIGREHGLLTVLAAARASVDGGIQEALVYQAHDVVGVSILVATGDTAEATWPTVAEGWFDGQPQWPTGVLGAVRLHVGLTSDQRHVKIWSTAPDWTADILDGQPPPEWGRSWWRPVKELVLWELAVPAPAHPVLTRRLLAVAAEHDEPITEDWFWSSAENPQALPPFTAYLLHAAKMRYEHALLQRDLDALNDQTAQVRTQSEMLATVLRRKNRSIGDVIEADRVLSDLRWKNDGLSDSLSRVRDMTQTVRVAQANLRSTLLGAPPGRSGSPIENDRQLSRWTLQQLIVVAAYLDSAQRRAAEMQRLAAAEVDDALVERRENLVVLQTAIIGAVLMALAGIQSMEYKADWLPGALRAPVIFLLAALALVLPSGVLRWPRGGRGDAAFASFDVAGVGVLGTTVGWFVVSLVTHLRTGGPAPVALSLAAAAVVASAAAGTAWWLLSRKASPAGDASVRGR